jgi:CRP/FNR family transcriptional regulator
MLKASSGRANIFAGLPQHLTSLLFAGATARRIKAGEQLFEVGDTGDGCYFVEAGLIALSVQSPAGEELVIAFAAPGETVGELAVIDGLPRSATAVAVKDSVLKFITRRSFEECTRSRPQIYRGLALTLAARLRETDEALAAASFLNSQARLARALWQLAKLLGENLENGSILIRHPIRHRDLAAIAGIARENVSRILSGWKRRKILTQPAGHYCINDPIALEQERAGGSSST